MPHPRYELFDHTADVGVEVRADSFPELFANAAFALFDIVTDLSRVRPQTERQVSIEATDREELLVTWLNELLFLHETEEELYADFDVQSVTDTRLSATIRGERCDPQRHEMGMGIKATTYHQLTVEQVGEKWKARVIFDT